MKKLVSLTLVLTMVLSLLSNPGLRAYAAEEPHESSIAFVKSEVGQSLNATEEEPAKAVANGTTVLAFTSDVHNGTQSGGETNVSANRLTTWLNKVNPLYDNKIQVMGFCGDMASAGSNSLTFWEYTQTVMGIIDSRNMSGVYAVGNHEYSNGSFDTTSNYPEVRGRYDLNAEGRAVDGENYVIYCLGTGSGHGSNWAYDDTQITALTTYINSVSRDKVIIILTHFPLHDYGMHRTGNTQPLLNALNTAAAGADGSYGTSDDKKIVYLWGHNHSEGDNNYDQVWLPGDTLPNANSSKSNFYYAAAGCMADSEYGQSAKVLGKGLVLTISEDNLLSFTYYDANANNVTEPKGQTISEEPQVPVAIEGVTITNTNKTVKVGRSLQLNYTTQPSNATVNTVSWTSSNTRVATVDNSGKVTGVSEGSATITLTVNDGLTRNTVTATAQISVEASASVEETIDITPTTSNPEMDVQIEVGDTLVINVTNGSSSSAYDFTITTANAGVAEILGSTSVNIAAGATAQFTVEGVADGKVDINISNNSQYGTQYARRGVIHLTVGDGSSTPVDPSGDTVDITPSTDNPDTTVRIDAGETFVINVTNGSSSSAYDFTASSSNTSIAAIQGSATINIASGAVGQFIVKGITEGSTDITIQNSNTYGSQYTRKGIVHVIVGAGSGDDPTPSGEGVTPEDGKKYVILASDGYALTSEGEEVGYSNGSGNQIYRYYGLSGEAYTVGENVAPERLLWTFTASGNGFYIQDQNGRYLNGTYTQNDEGGYTGRLKLDSTPDVWIISGAASGSTVNAGILKSTNASTNASSDKYLTHGNGENGGDNTNIFTLRSEENATTTTFYEYNDDGTYASDPDDPTPVGEYTINITADTEKAAAGDTVTFTITMGPVDRLGQLQMVLDIPEGLTYVENSFEKADGLEDTLGFDSLDWTEDTMFFNGYTTANYSSDAETVLGTFKCVVNEGFTGKAAVSLTDLEIFDCETWDDCTDYYTVDDAEVTVVGRFSVTFNMNGHGAAIEKQDVYDGDTATRPANPTAEGYAFGGWYSDSALTTEYTFTAPVTADIVLNAKWTPNMYTIQFVDEDGEVLQSSEVAYGEMPAYTGENPAKEATAEYTYTFTGWNPVVAVVTGNAVYQAVYEAVEIQEPIALIDEVSLILKGAISISMYVIVPEEASYATLTYDKTAEEGATKDFRYELSPDQSYYEGTDNVFYDTSKDRYKLIYFDIPAKEMTNIVTLTIYDENDQPIKMTRDKEYDGDTFYSYDYRIVDWSYAALELSTNPKTLALAKALLNYGYYAQQYFEYRLDRLPEVDLSAEMANVTADQKNDAVIPSNAKADVGYRNVTLLLKGAMSIYMHFDYEVTAVVKDKNGKEVDCTVEPNGNKWTLTIPNIPSKDLDSFYTIDVTYEGKTVEFKYCVLSYANLALASTTAQDGIKNLCKALYLYNAAANDYFE